MKRKLFEPTQIPKDDNKETEDGQNPRKKRKLRPNMQQDTNSQSKEVTTTSTSNSFNNGIPPLMNSFNPVM